MLEVPERALIRRLRLVSPALLRELRSDWLHLEPGQARVPLPELQGQGQGVADYASLLVEVVVPRTDDDVDLAQVELGTDALRRLGIILNFS